jgi:hypothetical protein
VVGDGGKWCGGDNKVMAVVGLRVGLRKPGLRVWGQKPKTGPLELSSGAPLETSIVGDGERWQGGDDEVMLVVGLCVGLCKPGLRVLGQNPETGPLGLGFVRAVGNGSGRRWGGVLGWCRRGGGGGVYAHSSTREGEGAGAQKLENSKTEP